jgi:hypothetical protein
MGRTLPSITQEFLEEQAAFMRFRRALRRSDQHALDDLFASAHQHLAAAAYAAHPLPFETFLLAMLLEEHKRVLRLQNLLGKPPNYPGDCSMVSDCFGEDPQTVPNEPGQTCSP